LISLKAAQQAKRATSTFMDALRTALPGITETHKPGRPLVESEEEWLVIHDPNHEPVRMDWHCPTCTMVWCPGGGCQICEDDYFTCCWGNCGSGGNGCCP
jgi:hypothetical protein